MGTLVTIQLLGRPRWDDAANRENAIERAFASFRRVEKCCTRFDPHSELMRLCAQIGQPVPVSPMLYEAESSA